MKQIVECAVCKKKFEVESSRLKHRRGKTCSRKCQYKLLSLIHPKRINKELEKKIVEDYFKTFSSLRTAKKYNLHNTTVLRILQRGKFLKKVIEINGTRLFKLDIGVYTYKPLYYKIDDKTGCHILVSKKNDYPDVNINKTEKRISHIILEKLGKKILPNQIVCHSCDNPKCINPQHLFIGTHKDNSQDMVKKGRNRVIRRNFKLNPQKVKEIRELQGRRSYQEVAKIYGLHPYSVHEVWRKKSWKWV